MIKLRIALNGLIRGLWTDDVALAELGRVHVRRASHVEFDDQQQCWCVREARPATWLRNWLQHLAGWPIGKILHQATTRAQALAWEHQYFQPGGPGWTDSMP